MSKYNGGPAFARPKSPKGEYTDSDVPGAQTGMTLRDYFAAKAASGLLSDHVARIEGLSMTPVSAVAEYAYALADAMLAERAK